MTSNRSVFPELVGSAGMLVDPFSPEDIARGVASVLEDANLRRSLIQKGLVSYTFKNRIKYFQPTSPERIKEYIETERRKFEEIDNDVGKLIPEFLVMQNFVSQKCQYQ